MGGEGVTGDDAGASSAVGAVRGIMVEGCAGCSEDGWQFSEDGLPSGACENKEGSILK